MAKYNKEVVNQICQLIKTDAYTIIEICNIVGIAERTYYNWVDRYAEFAEAIKEARDTFEARVLVECEQSLIKLIRGYSFEEKKTTYVDKSGKPVIKEQITTQKHIAPNLGAIIHYQTNKDPEHWQNRRNTDITTGGDKLTEPPRLLTKEEAKDLINGVEKEY